MPTPLVVRGVTFQYPTNNDTQWGQQATAWAVAVTNALKNVVVVGDIGPSTLAAIGNNVTSPTNVSGLVVSVAQVQAFSVNYYVYRGRGSPDNIEQTEIGTLAAVYKPLAGTWELSNTYTGDANIEFDITAAGQITYTTSDISGTGTYFGRMRYRLEAFPV